MFIIHFYSLQMRNSYKKEGFTVLFVRALQHSDANSVDSAVSVAYSKVNRLSQFVAQGHEV